MPIATPQGTLDFKSVDKVTFVGASSNTVIDTTTGSLGVGVGVGGPTSNLHVVGNTRLEGDINMLHTANTASIKLNSNVTTEFSRSKKLIKYPRVALTADAQTNSGYQGHFVTRSSQFSSYNAWEAFDENNPVGGNTGAGSGWASTIPGNYSVSTGAWGGGGTPHHTGSTEGEWIQIQLPDSIYLHDFVIESRSETTYGADGYDHGYPKDVVLYGSINGSSWDTIKTFTTGQRTFSEAHTENINETRAYKYFALVVNSTRVVNNTTQVTWTSIGQIRLFGVPEYDPDAHGTDVTIKSKANVPNTDWLEVYYDAKDLGDGAVTNPISGLGGTTNNGTAYGNTQISGGAFVFDGNGDYIETTVTTETGNWAHSYSFWMKADTDASSGAHFVALGTEGGSGSGTSVIRFSNDDVLWYFWSNDVTFKSSNLRGRWVHIVGTYDGGSVATSRKIFINNVEAPISSTAGTIGSLNLTTTSTPFKIGSQLNNTNTFKGSIANVRLFNRALTSDEIYQLYAYQKEEFGHGDLSMTLKAGRLGIGTSEPRAVLDVKGDTFSKVYKGGRTTFLTWDYEGQRYADISAANHSTYANIANILDHTFDIPSCYHDLGRATLKAFVQIDWRGEVNKPWNFGFRIEVTYNGDQIAYSSSSDHAASLNSRVCGTPTDSYHDDHYSTPEHASVTSLFKLTDCDVSPGSTLKVQLVGQWGDSSLSQRIWTGRTHGNVNRADYELPTSSFFVVLDVDDGY